MKWLSPTFAVPALLLLFAAAFSFYLQWPN